MRRNHGTIRWVVVWKDRRFGCGVNPVCYVALDAKKIGLFATRCGVNLTPGKDVITEAPSQQITCADCRAALASDLLAVEPDWDPSY